MSKDSRNSTERLVLTIQGMTCPGCESRIETALSGLDGIRSVKALYSSGSVEIVFDSRLVSRDALTRTAAQVLEDIGYRVSDGEGLEKSGGRSGFGAAQLLGIAVVLAAVFLILQHSGLLNRIPEISPSMGYGVLFIVGLLTSLHCVGMCGGINLSQSIREEARGTSSTITRLLPGLLYNGGRVISYTVIGGLVGALGSLVSFTGTARGWLVLAVGAFMVLMGLNMLGVFPGLRKITPRLPSGLRLRITGTGRARGPFVVGLLNGFMPCGPLQSIQLYALGTGSFLAGAFSMLMFSLGTVPLMFGLGALGSLLTKRFTRRMVQASAMIVMLLGVAMVGRGMNLTGSRLNVLQAGIFPDFGRVARVEESGSIARLQDGVQVVQMKLTSSSYQPIIVQKGIPVRWTIQAEASALNGCNNPVTIPEYNIVSRLKPGTNVIEFTPEKAGNILYTCWMGMISSTIRVVEDLALVTEDDVEEAVRYAETAPSTGSSCCLPGGELGGPLTLSEDYRIPTSSIGVASIVDGVQKVSVDVTEAGYSPAVLVMQRGVPAQWNFRAVGLNEENYRFIVTAYQANLELGEGDNTISFVPSFDFTFDNWQNTLHGYVKVVEDLNAVDLPQIRAQVEEFSTEIRNRARENAGESTSRTDRGGADSL